MTVLTCKICGGRIAATGEAWGVCESCGTEVTLPKIHDDIRAEFYNRANHFRANGDFDRAYSEFEHIIAQDPGDAETYWSLVLCKFGITYERDPESGQYEPLIANVRQEPIWEDVDYLRALQNSDEYAKALYRLQAQKIDTVQEYYFSLSRKEKPYDVFLCAKSRDSAGQLTKAGETAQLIYEKLTEKGIRVFREDTLAREEDKCRKDAHVTFALSSAKILFAITAGADDLNTRQAKHQWTRFMALMEKDRSKKIIPVYRDTEIYAIPEQIPTHEAICADQAGYWQDLTWGVLQILGKADRGETAEADGSQYLAEAKSAFEAHNFMAAEVMAEQALNYDPSNAYAHFYVLLSKHKAASFTDLLQVQEDWSANMALKRIIDLDDGELGKQAGEFRTEYINSTNYQSAKALMAQEDYEAAIGCLEKVGDYRDAPEVLRQCRKLDHHKKMLHQYRAETNNDTLGHLLRTLQREQANIYETLVQKMQRVHNAPRTVYPLAKMPIFLGILFAVALFILTAANVDALAGLDSACGILFVVLLGAYGFGIRKSLKMTVGLVALGFLFMSLFIHEPFDGVDNLVLAMFPLSSYLKESGKERKYAGYVADMNSYYKGTVEPLENRIIEDIFDRYGDVLTPQEIGTFNDVKSLTAYTMNLNIPEEEQ